MGPFEDHHEKAKRFERWYLTCYKCGAKGEAAKLCGCGIPNPNRKNTRKWLWFFVVTVLIALAVSLGVVKAAGGVEWKTSIWSNYEANKVDLYKYKDPDGDIVCMVATGDGKFLSINGNVDRSLAISCVKDAR